MALSLIYTEAEYLEMTCKHEKLREHVLDCHRTGSDDIVPNLQEHVIVSGNSIIDSRFACIGTHEATTLEFPPVTFNKFSSSLMRTVEDYAPRSEPGETHELAMFGSGV